MATAPHAEVGFAVVSALGVNVSSVPFDTVRTSTVTEGSAVLSAIALGAVVFRASKTGTPVPMVFGAAVTGAAVAGRGVILALGASMANVFVAKEGLLLVVGAAETLIATEGLLVICSDKIDGAIETLASGDIASLGMGEIMPSCTFKVATLGASVATVFVAKEGLLLVVGAAEAGVVPVEASSSS